MNKKWKLLARIICFIVIGIGVIGCGVSQNELGNVENELENIQKEYDEFCNLYNEYIDLYNVMAMNYNVLLDVVTEEDVNNLKKVSVRDNYEKNFEQFYNNDIKQESLDNMLNELNVELTELTTSYNELCIFLYNDVIEDFNVMAEKYNVLLDRLAIYEISNMPQKELIKKAITDNYDTYYKKWEDSSVICSEIESVREDIDKLNEQYYDTCLFVYNSVISDYNIVAEAYNDSLKNTSVHFIEGMKQDTIEIKETYNSMEEINLEVEELCSFLDNIIEERNILIVDYLIAKQITNPTEDWMIEHLEKVDSITGMQAVTKTNDPNGLLGKEGGYTSCIYFTIKDIEPSSIKGDSIIEKGTDVGGAIEIYSTMEYALNRCNYLSQFDGTLLYSGSYTIIGTIVIRTSYRLSNSQQIALINEITNSLTILE